MAPIQVFITERYIRITWIAFSTLWIFWGFAWVVRYAFGSLSATVNPDDKSWSVTIFNRLNRACDMLRDLTLLLLSAEILNTFARASTRAVMIITWFFFVVAILYFAFEVSYGQHRRLRFMFSLIFYSLGLAIAGLAFQQGFY